ncbi:hypothetical protein JHK85_001376 [Glycine max]|nr:hypothetical protein JHK85_001376 [Glycine max]KAG5088730.1 hypothetical protein JHK86_001342 [Glycine max]
MENKAFSSLRVPVQQISLLPLNEPGIKVIAPGVNHRRRLQSLLGKPLIVGANNLTWTLVKFINSESCDVGSTKNDLMAEKYSKLSVALSVMHECFEPLKNSFTRIPTALFYDGIQKEGERENHRTIEHPGKIPKPNQPHGIPASQQ